MKWLIHYIRQCFCKHDFEKSEGQGQESAWSYELDKSVITRSGTKVSLLCKKCGHHKSFWKF
jgi:hypothetical protein